RPAPRTRRIMARETRELGAGTRPGRRAAGGGATRGRCPATPAPHPGAAAVPFRSPGPRVGQTNDFPHHSRRRTMRRMTWATGWLILGAGLGPASAHPAEEAPKKLQGTWTATTAER